MAWLGIEVQVFCALAEANIPREIQRKKLERARNRTPVQDSVPQTTTSMGVNSSNLLDQVVDRMMGRMNSEVRRQESLIQQRPESIPNIHNLSFATDRVLGPERTGYMNRCSRLVNFSGSETPQKGEHSFAQWLHYYEISEPFYPENLMREAVVGSLRGNAYESIRGLGPRASVHKIVENLKKKYESKTNPDLAMQEFYRINQSPKETVMNFGTRLYSILTKIRTSHPNLMSELESEKRLHDRFFYGLKLPLRDSIRYHYEQLEADYEMLLDEAKKREDERNHSNDNNNPIVLKGGPVDPKESEMQALKQQVAELLKLAKAQNVINDKKNDRSSQERTNRSEGPREVLQRTFGPGPQTNSSGPLEGTRGQSNASDVKECSTPVGSQIPSELNS